MFRGISLFVLYVWVLAINIYFWKKYNIDYKKCFELIHNYSSLKEIFSKVIIMSLIYLVIFVLSLDKEIDEYTNLNVLIII